MTRRLLYVLPALAVAIVIWAVLTAGAPRPRAGARVLGGPPHVEAGLSVLVAVVESGGGRERPSPGVPLRVRARSGGVERVWSGASDETGHAEVWLDVKRAAGGGEPWLRVEHAGSGVLLAEGAAALDVDTWRASAQQRGGWIGGRAEGALEIAVAAADGVLAVPFATTLALRVTARELAPGGSRAVPGARLQVEADGAEPLDAAASPALTDALGHATLALRPVEHAVSLRVRAESGAEHGTWYGVLPVVPGALLAALTAPHVSVRSPIERTHAYASVVSRDARVFGAVVPLRPDLEGAASGGFELPERVLALLAREPLWAVVSSEPDKRSPGVVGWPLAAPALTAPRTFDVPDSILIDGVRQVLARDAAERAERRRWAAYLLLAVGALMGGLLTHEVRGRTAPAAGIPNGSVVQRSPGRWVIGAAIGCIVLGIGALAYFVSMPR